MKVKPLLVIAACMVLIGTMVVGAKANDLSVRQALHGDNTNCLHVIDLLHRYGDHVYNQTGSVIHTGGGPAIVPTAELGDIKIGDIALLSDGTDGCGPRIAVEICNYSTREVCNFSVSAVTILDRIFPHAPTTESTIEKIGPGESVEIQMELPIRCLAMGLLGATPVAYKTLIVAVDSRDQLLESNECNNLRIMHRVNIPVRTVVATEESPVAPQVPATPAAEPAAAAPTQEPPAGGGNTTLDDLDLDNLKLQDAAVSLNR